MSLPSGSSELPIEFRAEVTQALTEIGYTVAEWEIDAVRVLVPVEKRSSEKNDHAIGLENLYRRARGTDRCEWPAMIREFLGHISETLDGMSIPNDLTTIASQLRPRLGRPFSREGNTFPWGIPLPGTGLEINLVLDFSHTMAYVTEDMIEKTKKTAEDLLEVALANLRSATGHDFFEKVSDELEIFVGHSGDGYDAARALLIEDLLPESPAGYLVAIPSRDELAVWPVSFAALSKVHAIKLFAEDNFRNHAYPVTDDVFWVWRGAWHLFGIQIGEQDVTLSPPDEFLVALKELGETIPGVGATPLS